MASRQVRDQETENRRGRGGDGGETDGVEENGQADRHQVAVVHGREPMVDPPDADEAAEEERAIE